MRTLPRLLAALLTALLIGVAAPAVAQGEETPRDPMADLVLSATELTADAEKGTTIIGEELLPAAPETVAATFTTQVIEAPIPFNAVVPQWMGDAAETIELRVRTGPDGQTWGDWVPVHANPDWMETGEAEIVGEMVLVPAAGVTHRFVQVQVLFSPTETTLLPGLENELLPSSPATPPSLRQLRLTFIDTTGGPTADELIDLQQQLDEQQGLLPESADAYPKPFVVSRAAWCTHADCNYTNGLEYHRVTHLIVHHTVSNNSSADWPAVVRAIWNFHTYGRGWGDVGYNYLIDPNGVIYEGHNGGDDVVGTHAAGANTGSMAASLLGNFTAPPTGIRPPTRMLNSLVELLSWKADQRDIDIFDASDALPNMDWGLPHLMGHRDVYGTTECPGDQAHVLIPWLRDQIAGKIGLTNPFIMVDENSPAFTRSTSGDWFVPIYLCGFNNHAWYTWTVNNAGASNNWGEWRPTVPAAGRYRIDVYAPYCRTGRGETRSASYTIRHADGTSTRTVNQQARIGLWTTLGEFNLSAGNGNVIRLTDLAGDSDLGLWFDAIRLLPLNVPPPDPDPTATNTVPTANVWQNKRAVTFSWQVTEPQEVWYTTLQVATDPTFLNVLVNQSWWGVVTSHTHPFAADYPALYWRVLLSRQDAPIISSPPTRFQLDATPPQTAVQTPLTYVPNSGRFAVRWGGTDATSGLDRFHIDVRAAGQSWTRWLSDTRLPGADFVPPNPALVYEFRAQGIDLAGNVEPPSAADASTANAVTLNNTIRVPLIAR